MRPAASRRRITAALIGLLALVGGIWLAQDGRSGEQGGAVPTGRPAGAAAPAPAAEQDLGQAQAVQALSTLPPETGATWELIQRGGPFDSDRDGATFGNREGLLPARPPGYYREYTVPTPGSDDRGARRLVTGRGGELYYTADHYESFVAVDPDR